MRLGLTVSSKKQSRVPLSIDHRCDRRYEGNICIIIGILLKRIPRNTSGRGYFCIEVCEREQRTYTSIGTLVFHTVLVFL